jgi:uncharacterized protein
MVFNDLFCLSYSQVHTLSIGAANPSNFDEHLKTLALLDRADEVLPPILARLEGEAIASLGEDWYKTWHQGLPSHEATPGGINIPAILWLWNLAKAYDLEDYAKMRYNLLGNGGHWFAGQQATQLENLDLRPSLVHSPHAAQIPSLLKAAHGRFGSDSIKRLSQLD